MFAARRGGGLGERSGEWRLARGVRSCSLAQPPRRHEAATKWRPRRHDGAQREAWSDCGRNSRRACLSSPSHGRSDGSCDYHVRWRMIIRPTSGPAGVGVGVCQRFGAIRAMAAVQDYHRGGGLIRWWLQVFAGFSEKW